MKINRDQLLKINELLLKKLSPEDLSKLEGKEIKVRAKVINTGESVHYQIEEISGDAKKVLKAKANDEIIVKGCIHKSTLGNKHDFKVDLSYVLPPEKNAAGTETGK